MRRRDVVAGLAASGIATAAARAQGDWPNRPVRVIVPYPPGGPSDSSTRIVMDKVASLLGQPVVIENKAGASGLIGAEFVKNQPADGYLFLTTTTAMVCITRHLQPIPFDPEKDFTAVARMATSWIAMAATPSLPVKDVKELVAYAKANPGKLNFGSAGMATITQLFGEIFKIEAGIDMTHVPYKGSAPATQGLLGNEVQIQFDSVVLPQIKAGKLKGLAMTGDARWHQLPDMPTLKEQGYGKQGGDSWYGILAAAATPAPAVARMAKAIADATADKETQTRLDNAGLRATYLDSAAFRQRIDDETKLFGEVIRKGNIKI